MTDNMDIWNTFSVTDRAHTKEFTRSGGFKGTAIKPMYAIQRMTEKFGACGTGWGYTKPDYQIVPGSDGQVIVYCTVGLWHGEDMGTLPDVEKDYVWGVGGDFVIVKQSSGLRSDDEAFKKAFTDALMNAMKHLGMSADVHMGQFDGSKYTAPQPKKAEPVDNDLFNKALEALKTAQDMESLKKAFEAAWPLAKGDKPAQIGLTKVKDERKQQLEGNK